MRVIVHTFVNALLLLVSLIKHERRTYRLGNRSYFFSVRVIRLWLTYFIEFSDRLYR